MGVRGVGEVCGMVGCVLQAPLHGIPTKKKDCIPYSLVSVAPPWQVGYLFM